MTQPRLALLAIAAGASLLTAPVGALEAPSLVDVASPTAAIAKSNAAATVIRSESPGIDGFPNPVATTGTTARFDLDFYAPEAALDPAAPGRPTGGVLRAGVSMAEAATATGVGAAGVTAGAGPAATTMAVSPIAAPVTAAATAADDAAAGAAPAADYTFDDDTPFKRSAIYVLVVVALGAALFIAAQLRRR